MMEESESQSNLLADGEHDGHVPGRRKLPQVCRVLLAGGALWRHRTCALGVPGQLSFIPTPLNVIKTFQGVW